MLAKYLSIIRNYVLSVFTQRKCTFYHQNTLLDAFRTHSHYIVCRIPSMVIPLLANQDMTPMLIGYQGDNHRRIPANTVARTLLERFLVTLLAGIRRW